MQARAQERSDAFEEEAPPPPPNATHDEVQNAHRFYKEFKKVIEQADVVLEVRACVLCRPFALRCPRMSVTSHYTTDLFRTHLCGNYWFLRHPACFACLFCVPTVERTPG